MCGMCMNQLFRERPLIVNYCQRYFPYVLPKVYDAKHFVIKAKIIKKYPHTGIDYKNMIGWKKL